MVSKVLIPVVVTYARSEEYAPVVSPLAENAQYSIESDDSTTIFKFDELSQNATRAEQKEKENGIVYTEFMKQKINERDSVPEFFYLSIPKLNITNAKVKTNSTEMDPSDALGHYNGSCLPNEACNTFIFGHSTYASTPNKYEEGDYREIFSKLSQLEYGDEFTITYNDTPYRYIVDETKIENPDEVNPLEQPMPKSLGEYTSTVQLFTCTPPGTTKYRLSVIGKLVE